MKSIAEQLKHDFDKGSLRLYDSNGNEIYYEDSDGYWIKREFDSNGNLIYYENSNGYWSKKEYDTNGNKIYYENSNGAIEDNRPNEITQDKVREAAEKAFNQARKQTSMLGEKDVQMTDYLISPKYKTFEDYWNSKKH